MKTGRCLCGAVRYKIDGPLDPVVACHCSQCRRWGGDFIAATSARREDVTVEGAVAWFDSTPGEVRRGFCPTCGSHLFWDRRIEEKIDIWAGTLDAPTGLRLAYHIFTADKGDYYEIADGLPQYPGAREE